MIYVNAFLYIIIGLTGALAHYGKKCWIDDSTDKSLWRYLCDDKPSTWRTLIGIAAAEIGLSALQAGEGIALTELVAALSLGFSFDSTLNRA